MSAPRGPRRPPIARASAQGGGLACALALALPLALAGLALAPAARADDEQIVFPPTDGDRLEIRWRQLPQAGKEHRYGYLLVRVANRGDEPREVEVALVERGGGGAFESRGALRVEAKSQARLVLPFATSPGSAELETRVDGRAWSSHYISLGGSASGVSTLHVLTRELSAQDRSVLESGLGLGRGLAATAPVGAVRPAELPDHPMLLSAFDLIVLDAAAEGLEVAHEQVLADWCAQGGALVILGGAPAADRPLGRLARAPDRVTGLAGPRGPDGACAWGGVGFGVFVLATSDGLHPGAGLVLPSRLRDPPLDALQRGVAAPAIPGVGDVPVPLFVGAIVVFVVLVGPVNVLVVVRRWRRPTRALIIAPVMGFGLTAAILVYGLVADGLGIRSTQVSLTLLDQVERRAAQASGRLYYAAFAPRAGLRPAAGTTLVARPRGDEEHPTVQIDASAGIRFTQGTLPSRTTAPFFAATVGVARERLRFKREGDGYRLLADESLEPTGEGSVVLRDRADGFFILDGAGRLRPVAEAEARRRAGAMLDLPEPAVVFRPRWHHRMIVALGGPHAGGASDLAGWLRDLHGGPPPFAAGTYVALVRRPPGWDALGLEGVEDEVGHHVVVGALGEDDFVE